MKLNKLFFLVFLSFFVIPIMFAWTPPSDIDGRDYYNIYNFTNLSADYIQQQYVDVCLENGSNAYTYNATYDEFAFNQTNSTFLTYGGFWFNQTNSTYLTYGSYWVNQTTGLIFNFNQTNSTFLTYGEFWVNQSAGLYSTYGFAWFNQTANLYSVYGSAWFNQTAGLVFNFNQTNSTFLTYGSYWINQTAGLIYNYNQTNESYLTYGFSWFNQTAGLVFNFNQTNSTFLTYGDWWHNQTVGLIFNFNQTNSTYLTYNEIWRDTFNATYDTKADYLFQGNTFNGTGDFNTSGNVSSNWFYGKLNWSWIESKFISAVGKYFFMSGSTLNLNTSELNETIDARVSASANYTAGLGINLTLTNFSVEAGDGLLQEIDGLKVADNGITDAMLKWKTGQNLSTADNVTFNNVTVTTTLNPDSNITLGRGIIIQLGQRACFLNSSGACGVELYVNASDIFIIG